MGCNGSPNAFEIRQTKGHLLTMCKDVCSDRSEKVGAFLIFDEETDLDCSSKRATSITNENVTNIVASTAQQIPR